jgi:hypothetical protein
MVPRVAFYQHALRNAGIHTGAARQLHDFAFASEQA